MNIRLMARGVEVNSELKNFVERTAYFALGRFEAKIMALSIRLSDANGTRGGVDQCCQISMKAGLTKPVIVSERQPSIHSAIARAVERAAHVLERQSNLAGPASRRARMPSCMTSLRIERQMV